MQFVDGFLWGSGLSLGIAVGLFVWIFLRTFANKICGIANDWERLQKYNSKSLAALEERNRLTYMTNTWIEQIVTNLIRRNG